MPPGETLEETIKTTFLAQNALETLGGRPISVRVTVVNLHAHGPTANATIAHAGGGALFDVEAQDATGFSATLSELLHYDLKCEPADLAPREGDSRGSP